MSRSPYAWITRHPNGGFAVLALGNLKEPREITADDREEASLEAAIRSAQFSCDEVVCDSRMLDDILDGRKEPVWYPALLNLKDVPPIEVCDTNLIDKWAWREGPSLEVLVQLHHKAKEAKEAATSAMDLLSYYISEAQNTEEASDG